MIEITNIQADELNKAVADLSKLCDGEKPFIISASTRFRIAQVAFRLREIVAAYELAKMSLILRVTGGSVEIRPEHKNFPEFVEQYLPLQAMRNPVELPQVVLSELQPTDGSAPLRMELLTRLTPIIRDDSRPRPPL